MEKVKKYKTIIKNILGEVYADLLENPNKSIKPVLIEDEKNGHFLLYLDGWRGQHRIYGCSIHVEVNKEGKVWLHYDGTDMAIGQIMVDKGIPKHQLVPGFQPPIMRQDMGYAVA